MDNNFQDLELVLRNDSLSANTKKTLSLIGRIISLVFMYAFLAFMAILMIFPFYWMIITSLKRAVCTKS